MAEFYNQGEMDISELDTFDFLSGTDEHTSEEHGAKQTSEEHGAEHTSEEHYQNANSTDNLSITNEEFFNDLFSSSPINKSIEEYVNNLFGPLSSIEETTNQINNGQYNPFNSPANSKAELNVLKQIPANFNSKETDEILLTYIETKFYKPEWIAYKQIVELFLLYLYKKYNHTDSIFYIQEIIIDIFGFYGIQDNSKYIKFISDKINSGVDILYIPVSIIFDKEHSHANLLVYKKSLNTIEHFEPHGTFREMMNLKDKYGNKHNIRIIPETIEEQIKSQILDKLMITGAQPLRYISTYDNSILESPTTGRVTGCQAKECAYTNVHSVNELGYCSAWMLLYMEFSLRYPTLSMNNIGILINNSAKKLSTLNIQGRRSGTNSIYKFIIRGYSTLIVKLIKYFYKYYLGIPFDVYLLNFSRPNTRQKTNIKEIVKNILIIISHCKQHNLTYNEYKTIIPSLFFTEKERKTQYKIVDLLMKDKKYIGSIIKTGRKSVNPGKTKKRSQKSNGRKSNNQNFKRTRREYFNPKYTTETVNVGSIYGKTMHGRKPKPKKKFTYE